MGRPIVFFDGVCGLCNGFVDRTIRADRRDALRFATLQGETARRLLPSLPEDPGGWTVVFLDERGTHERSDAVLAIWRRLGGARLAAAAVAGLVPRPLRDAVYRSVARRRYRWFGRRETCRVPSPREAAKFLP